MRIALVTDAWVPHVNGVVRTLTTVVGELERAGHAVMTVSPERFRAPCPAPPSRTCAWRSPRPGRSAVS